MDLVLTIIKLVIMLSVVAIVHEFGHFLFAKIFKMTVNEFSIGFGKKLWQKEYKGTKYSLRLVLMGGYVALEGEEGDSKDTNAFSKKPAWQRIIVMLAGATFNAILAIIILMSTNLFYDTASTRVKSLEDNSPLLVAGIQDGDTITRIGNTKTHVYEDIYYYSDTSKNDVEIQYIRNGKTYVTLAKDVVITKGYLGIYFDPTKKNTDGTLDCVIQITEPGGAASEAGIKAGDEIVRINNEVVDEAQKCISIIESNANNELVITVLRNGEEKEIQVTPSSNTTVEFGIVNIYLENTGVSEAWYSSISTVKRIAKSYVDLFKGKVRLNQMSGVVGIGEVVSTTEGFTDLIVLLATLSLAIGIANILPFPPLDGGKVVLVLWEVISRKKVSEKVEIILSYIGFGLLIALTIYVTIKDIIRVI